MKIKRYNTGLVIGWAPKKLKPPFMGAGWVARFIVRKDENLRVVKKYKKGKDVKFFRKYIKKEVVINAKSWRSAQKALNLIISSIHLGQGAVPWLEDSNLVAYNDTEPRHIDPKSCKSRFAEMGGIPLGCAIAAKASRKNKWIYAIYKYNFSISLCSIAIVDLQPTARHIPMPIFPDQHVKFSHAIISAYAVLEELGLGKPQRKKTFIGNRLNPAMKKAIEQKLLKSKIDINETYLWTLRGTKTKIEKEMKIPFFKGANKPRWSKGMYVRDCEISLVEAIVHAAWLRNYIASHDTKDLTKSISPYDVINVQHLARRTLLETLGFWKSMPFV